MCVCGLPNVFLHTQKWHLVDPVWIIFLHSSLVVKKNMPFLSKHSSLKISLESVDNFSIWSFRLGRARIKTFCIPNFTIASLATFNVFSDERLAIFSWAFFSILLQLVMSLQGAWRTKTVFLSPPHFLHSFGTWSSKDANGKMLWGGGRYV